MAATTQPNLGLKEGYALGDNGWVDDYNKAQRTLEALVQPTVAAALASPPGSPANGDCYLVIATATGAWVGWENRIVRYRGGIGWEAWAPKKGWRIYIQNLSKAQEYNGTAWADIGSFSGAYSALSGIPAAIDALDGLTPAADRLPYFTGASTAALATLSAFIRTLLDDADAAAARATLGALSAALKGAANGVAELGSDSKILASQMPTAVDEIIEATNFAALPGTGEANKIYLTLDDGVLYRWGGTAYGEISSSLALGETSATAYRGDRGKTAYDHSQATGNPHGLTRADIGAHPLENQQLSTDKAVQFYRLKLTAPGHQLGVAPLSLDNDEPVIAYRSANAEAGKRRWNLGFSGNAFGLLHYADNEDWLGSSWSVFPNSTSGKLEFRFGGVDDTDVFVPWNGNGMLKVVEADGFGSKLVPAVAGVDYALPTEPEPAPLWPKVLWDDAGYPQFSLASVSSLLSENVPTRTIPANTWTEGMTLTFEFEGTKRGATTNLLLEFFIGPAGVYTTPYYIPASAAFPAGTFRFKTRVVLKCLSPGASGQFEYSLETTRGGTTDEEMVYSNVTTDGYLTTIDTTVDRVIDFVGYNGSGSSVIGLHSHCVMTIPGAGSGFLGGGASSAVPFVGIFANAAALPASATPGHFATTQDGNLYVWEA